VIQFLGIKGKSFHGTITSLVATANPETKRRQVYVTLDAMDDTRLVAGMTGEASITKASRDHALIVPRRAVLGNFVFLVESGTINVQTVKIGFRGLYRVEILEGLEEGNLVVVENLQDLRDGDPISIRE
jgi:multidrug efflux pump subunit AcrA (membrane-fusion protein)